MPIEYADLLPGGIADATFHTVWIDSENADAFSLAVPYRYGGDCMKRHLQAPPREVSRGLEVAMFFYIEPEVAGGIGPNSELHHEDGRLVVTRLNYEFDGWLGDALLETTPCFIVTNDARKMIEQVGLTGVAFSNVEVTQSGAYADLYGDKPLPHFWWMAVGGTAEADDFGIASDLRLVASERALATLQEAGLTHAEVCPVGH